ncbi:MAG: DMT family transporter [Gammaproteobacteria bacterium]|nr:DMT family transporter [Gammaproteobacteria bacterium]
MSVPAAFLGVIIIWSTTPLAIQWSSEGWGYMFGVTGRMVLGAAVCVALVLALRHKIALDRKAWETYIAAGLGIYGAMMMVYWGSQYISSGLVAVIFGLTPVVTAVLAAFCLQESSLTPGKIAGAALGIAGLAVIFGADINGHAIAWQGVVAMLISVVLHSVSAVWVKRINRSLPALTTTTGGLLVVAPLYLITWVLVDGNVPVSYELRPATALIYLGVFGSVIGFSLYFYILKNWEANRVALIPLITPVSALLLGQVLNNEVITFDIWLGAFFILFALSMHQWGDYWLQSIRSRVVTVRR